MNKSETIKELANALSKAQGEFAFAAMNATNPFLKNKYADLGEVIKSAKPALAKHGISFTQLVSSTDGKVGVETVIMHESGEWISSLVELPIESDKGRSLAQSMGAVITYLRRYTLASALGIYADQDDDGNAHDDKKTENSKPVLPAELNIMNAVHVKTPKGTPLGNLTDEQLVTVQLKAEGEIQKVAEFLLGVAIPEDYDNYFSLVTVAEDKKVAIDKLPEKCTRIQLWREMQKLIEATSGSAA